MSYKVVANIGKNSRVFIKDINGDIVATLSRDNPSFMIEDVAIINKSLASLTQLGIKFDISAVKTRNKKEESKSIKTTEGLDTELINQPSGD